MKNKKLFFVLLASLLILSLFAIIIKADTTPTPPSPPTPPGTSNLVGSGEIDPATGLPKEVAPIKDIGDTLSDENKTTNYLKKEWQKILEKNQFWSPIVSFIFKLDPLSNVLLGMPIAFSWFFFLTLIIWITFVVLIFRITGLFEITNKWIHFAVAIAIIAAITYFRYPKSISGIIVALIILQKIWWVQYIIMGIVIVSAILLIIFSKELKVIWKKMKEKNKKRNDELEKNEFHNDVKLLEGFRKEMAK